MTPTSSPTLQQVEPVHAVPGLAEAPALPHTEIRALSARVFHRWLLPTLAEWTAIILLCIGGFAIDHWAAWALITVLIGSRQHALGVLGHDGAHYTAAENRKLNDLASELLCFWPVITGLEDFRRFHFDHHRHFGTDRDPELLFKNQWSTTQWRTPITRTRILLYFLMDCLGFGLYEVLKAYRLMGKVSLRSWLGPLLWWTVVGGLLFAFGWQLAILIWFIALGTSFWGFHRLRTWTEHVGTDATHRVHANWWQRLLITPHCSWSHDEHHNYPSIPFWQRHQLRSDTDPGVPMGEHFASFAPPTDRRQDISGH